MPMLRGSLCAMMMLVLALVSSAAIGSELAPAPTSSLPLTTAHWREPTWDPVRSPTGDPPGWFAPSAPDSFPAPRSAPGGSALFAPTSLSLAASDVQPAEPLSSSQLPLAAGDSGGPVPPVPLPATLWLLAFGAAALIVGLRRRETGISFTITHHREASRD